MPEVIKTQTGVEMVVIPGGWFQMGSNDGEADEWIRLTPAFLGSGTSLPTTGMINGDSFYRTDEKLLYTYNPGKLF